MDVIIDSMDMSLSKLRETVKAREAWNAAVHGVEWDTTERLHDNSVLLKWFYLLNTASPQAHSKKLLHF